MLFLAVAFSSPTAVAQRTPQPVFTELFSYDPAAPLELLGKWLISSQLDSKLQPLRVGVVEDRIGKTVGRITVQEGDGLAGANEAMLRARHYICNSEGSRAAAVEADAWRRRAQRAGGDPSRSDRATGAGELVKFGELVWYRFSFKIAGDWPQDVPVAGRQPLPHRHPPDQAGFLQGREVVQRQPLLQDRGAAARRARALLRAGGPGAPCAQPPMVMRTQICRRDLPRESWTTVQVRLNPAHDASGHVEIWLNGTFCGTYQGPMADRDYGARRNGAPLHQRTAALRHLS